MPFVLVALSIRAWGVAVLYPPCPNGEPAIADVACYGREPTAAYAVGQAFAVADGRGFIDPTSAVDAPGALVGPLPSLVGAVGIWTGISGSGGERLPPMLVGGGAVVLVGLAAWSIGGSAGRVAGPIAAALAAVWPGFWSSEALGQPDALLVPLAAGLVLALDRLWRSPSLLRAAVVGVVVGLWALVRADGALLAAVVLVGVAFGLRSADLRSRLAVGAVVVAFSLAVLAPWSVLTSARFGAPLPLGSGLGAVALEASCGFAVDGPAAGSRDRRCLDEAGVVPGDDELTRDRKAWDAALGHLSDDPAHFVVVVPQRALRIWGAVGVTDSVGYDRYEEARGGAAELGWAFLWPALALAVVGLVSLRRRSRSIVPLLVLPAAATLAAAASGGVTRLRIGADVAVIIAASLGAAAVARRVLGSRLDPVVDVEQTTTDLTPTDATPTDATPADATPADTGADASGAGTPGG